VTQATGPSLVHSPVAAACFACHDDASAQAHIRAEGGIINAPRSSLTFPLQAEKCFHCHGPGAIGDVNRVH
jgi:hypothetical protein